MGKTKSEEVFEQYCELRGYRCTEIGAGPEHGKTPDREVTAEGYELVAEIKELTANAEDRRRAAEMVEKGWSAGGDRPGRRVQMEIKRAAKQLKARESRAIPLVLVLYDNIVVDGERVLVPNKHFDPAFIDFAMYGLQTVHLDSDSLEHVRDGRGGKRQMTAESRKYISAISELYEDERGSPFMATYHNCFATVPLPFEVFSGHEDHHFVKPDHPNSKPQRWQAVKG